MILPIGERKQAERQLAASERHLRSVIETTPECVKLIAADGTLLDMNAAGLRMIEADSLEAVTGRNLYHLVVDEHRVAFRALTERAFGGTAGTLEYEIIGLKGGRRWLETHVSPLRDAAGTVTAALGITRDISEQKQAAFALHASEEQLRLYVEHIPAAVAMFDRDMNYLQVSRRWLTDYELSEQSVIGRCHYDVFPELPQRWKEVHQRCLAGAVERADEDGFVRPGGQTDLVHWEVRPWAQSDGSIGGIIIFSEDVTERKKAESALHDSEARYRQLFEANPHPMWIVELESLRFLAVNEAAIAHYGYSRAEFLAMTNADIRSPDEVAMLHAAVESIRRGGKPPTRVRHRLKGGRIIDVDVSSQPTQYEGQAARIVMAQDVTEQNAAAREVAQSRGALRTLLSRLQLTREEERTRVAREVHDELGQLLTGLKMDLRWMERKLSGSEPAPTSDNLLERVVAAAELNDITIATVQRIAANLRPGALDQLGLAEALAYRLREVAQRADLAATFHADAELPPLPAMIASELYYICQEALTNVVRHAKATRVDVHLSEDAGTVVLEVCDDGVGMGSLERPTTQTLGLLGMQERALQCGGSVLWQDVAPHGTRVSVRVPWPQAGASTDDPAPTAPAAPATPGAH